MGLFTENLQTKFLFPLLIQTGLVVSLEENYYKKCYVLNPLLIPNSKDSILLHNKINLPNVQSDTKDNVLDRLWCATPDTCSALYWPRAVILFYSKDDIISKTQSGSSKLTNALKLENGCSTALMMEKTLFYKAKLKICCWSLLFLLQFTSTLPHILWQTDSRLFCKYLLSVIIDAVLLL